MRFHRWMCAIAVSGALAAGCGTPTNKATGGHNVRPIVLSLANWEDGDYDVGEWVHAVERLSHGTLKIDVRGGWRRTELNSDAATLEDVRAGRVDLAHIPTRAWDKLGVHNFDVLDAPLLVDSLDLEERIITNRVGSSILDAVRSVGVEPIALLPGALRSPVGISRDLLGPTGYGGARIGLRPSTIHEATMRALGARVDEVSATESLSGLDGTESDLASIDVAALDRHASSVTANVVLWPRFSTVVMNRAAWKRLNPVQRAALTDAGRAAIDPAMSVIRAAARGATESLCARGFSLAIAGGGQLAALRRAVEPIYSQLARLDATRNALERIRALKAGLSAEPVPKCGAQHVRSRAPSAPLLLGRWYVGVTRAQMQAALRLPGEQANDNWGQFTLILGADGRFNLLNSRYSGSVGFGTWSARGDLLTFVPSGSVIQGAGEMWHYHWTLFRGALALRRVDLGPTALTVAPLHRR
jgi:TRAP-type C4-dicarboxylate transport system substrate-binding protein